MKNELRFEKNQVTSLTDEDMLSESITNFLEPGQGFPQSQDQHAAQRV